MLNCSVAVPTPRVIIHVFFVKVYFYNISTLLHTFFRLKINSRITHYTIRKYGQQNNKYSITKLNYVNSIFHNVPDMTRLSFCNIKKLLVWWQWISRTNANSFQSSRAKYTQFSHHMVRHFYLSVIWRSDLKQISHTCLLTNFLNLFYQKIKFINYMTRLQ